MSYGEPTAGALEAERDAPSVLGERLSLGVAASL